ncbi:MAG: hypothetical protein SOX89_02580 [Treponema sp.]|nr:hypothetical protein [Treponema sp.]
MKKILKFLSVNFLSLVFFTGCYDSVFDDIRKEVPLEDSEISGYINDLTRFRSVYDDGTKEAEFLILQNGIIYAKQISPAKQISQDDDFKDLSYGESHGKWFKTGSGISSLSYDYYGEKFNGEYIVKTASEYNVTKNKSTLYALSTKWGKNDDYGRNIPTEFKLYSMDKIDGTWSPISDANIYLKNCFATGKDSNYGTDLTIQLFCTNTPKIENRRAFLRLGREDKWFNAVDEKGNTIEVDCIIFELSDSKLTPIYYSKRTKQSDSTYLKEIYKDSSLASSKPETLSSKTVSAVEMQGEVYFLPFIGSTGNSTPESDGTFICYGSGTNAFYFTKLDYESLDGKFTAKKIFNGTETDDTENINTIVAFWTGRKDSSGKVAERPSELKEVGLSTNNDIISASASKDDILFGTRGNGVFRAIIKQEGSIEKTNEFISNTSSIMASPYIIRMIFTVDPSKDGATTSRYSAMDFIYTASNAGANDSHRGLWSYYKERGNWNRE